MAKSLKIIFYTSLVLLGIGILSLYFLFSPSHVDLFPKCPFHSLTGYHCPGCGSQRAIHALLHGRIVEAIHYNFLIILAFLVLVYKAYLWVFPYDKNNKRPTKNLLYSNATPWIILIVIIGFWVARNIPIPPFTYLAP